MKLNYNVLVLVELERYMCHVLMLIHLVVV